RSLTAGRPKMGRGELQQSGMQLPATMQEARYGAGRRSLGAQHPSAAPPQRAVEGSTQFVRAAA
ncbi:Hypothetical predicted protein, partial [Pelobates cultripes]